MDRTDAKSSDSKIFPERHQLHSNQTLLQQESTEVMISDEESCFCEEHSQKKEAEDEKRGSEKDGVPYDSGWAWMVLFGCFVNYVIMGGYGKAAFGLFFVALLQRYRAQASETALIFSIRAAVFSLSSWFVMNFMFSRLGARRTVLIGVVLLSLSAIVSSFINSLMLTVCLLGILHGVAQSTVFLPGDILLASYFRKRRSLAIPLARCGISFGNILMPIAISYFLEHYGLSGALLLTGGLCLHTVPATMLLRPTSFYERRRTHSGCSESRSVKSRELDENSEATVKLFGSGDHNKNLDTLQTIEIKVTKQPGCNEHTRNNCSQIINTELSEGENELKREQLCIKSRCLETMTFTVGGSHPELSLSSRNTATGCQQRRYSVPELSDWHKCNNSSDVIQKSMESSGSQNMDVDNLVTRAAPTIGEFVHSSQNSDADCTKDINGHSDFETTLKKVSSGEKLEQQSPVPGKRPKSTFCMMDFWLFGNPLFWLLLIYFVLFPCTIMMIAYLPALASENLTASQGALLLSIIGGLDLVCRLSCVVIANAKIVRASTMIATACLILGVTVHFVRFMTSFGHFVALSVLLGLLDGVNTTMLPILILDFVGLDNMAKAQGFCQPIMGAFSAAVYPLLGYIRDATGSYIAVYHVLGSNAILAAAVLFCERWARRLAEQKQQKASQKNSV